MPRFEVIGFGALNLDLIFEVPAELVQGLPYRPGREYLGEGDPADLLFLLGKKGRLVGRSGGGSAANTVFALSRWGLATGFIGKVGEDEEGNFLLQSLGEVNKEGIGRAGRSGLALSLLEVGNPNRILIVFPGANDALSFAEINLAYAREARFLHLTSFFGDLPFQAQQQLLTELAGQCRISFDPGMPYARKGLATLAPLLEKTEVFFAAEEEIELLCQKGYVEGAQQIRALGPKVVVCKRGPQGATLFSPEGIFPFPAEAVEVVDTTGAGDVFNAGFLAGLLEGKSLTASLQRAIHWASQSIRGRGRERYPRRGKE